MKRRSSLAIDDGPAQKCLADSIQIDPDTSKKFYDRVCTCGKVIWSGTVEIPDSQKRVFDCSFTALPQDEGIKSLFPSKQLTIHSIPVSAGESLSPHKIISGLIRLILCKDENTDMMSYSAFSQAIRLDRFEVGCTVLGNSASVLHLLFVYSFSSGHEHYITGYITPYHANDTLLGILRSHGLLLPCANLEHVLAKENARLKKELQSKKKILAEKKLKEREWIEKQNSDNDRPIGDLIRQLQNWQHRTEPLVQENATMKKDVQLKESKLQERKTELTNLKMELEEMNKQIMEKDKVLKKGQHEYKVLEKEKTKLEEELQCKVQMLEEEKKLHQEKKKMVEKKEENIVNLQGEMEEKIKLVEEQKMELTEMEKKIEEKNTQIMEKDNALIVKDTKIMTLQQNQHKVEEMLEGALRMVRHSDAGREGLHNINQSNNIEADTEQILMMESSRLELQNEVTMKQAALDEIGNMMENEFRCSICSELFIKTVTLNCSHSFCAFCIQKWQKDKRTCPNCRNIITASVRSVVLDSLIEKISDKSGDEAKQRRNETVKERERDMQQEGQLCSIEKYVRHSDDETSTASSPASSLARLSPSAAFMSPYNPPGTFCSMYSPYPYSPSHN